MTPMAEKRVVLMHLAGERKGMAEILGIVDHKDDAYPASLQNIDLGGRTGSAIHAGTFPRFVLYREWVAPGAGRLGEFHPQQR